MIKTELLCNPYLEEPLKLSGKHLIGLASGHKFQIKDDIPIIIDPSYLSSRNKLNKFIYGLSAGLYERLLIISDKLKYSNDLSVNQQFLTNLSLDSGQKVLEVGVGPAISSKFLPAEVEHYGIDISWNMLRKAKKNMEKINRAPYLAQALAEYIPFKDNIFNTVFQIGTLQFSEDPFKAINEMARVAKPNTTIYILDEIRGGRNIFKRSPAHGMHVTSTSDLIRELPRLVPQSMQNIKAKVLDGNQYYQLQFTKPK